LLALYRPGRLVVPVGAGPRPGLYGRLPAAARMRLAKGSSSLAGMPTIAVRWQANGCQLDPVPGGQGTA